MDAILPPQSLPPVFCRTLRSSWPMSRVSYCNNTSILPRSVSLKNEMSLADKVFDEMPRSNAFAWNNLIRFHLSSGELDNVMSIYQEMLLRGVRPDRHTLPRVLDVARSLDSLRLGRQLHGQALKLSLLSKEYVINSLIKLYDYFDCTEAVELLFDKTDARMSFVSWTLLMRMYIRENKPKLAIRLFYQMVNSGMVADSVAVMTATGACGTLMSLQEGKKVEEIAQASGLASDLLVGNSLLKMYIRCESVRDARRVFDQMVSKDLISWTEMISGHVRSGGFNEGLKLFQNMVSKGVRPDGLAVSAILPACARMTAHKQGKQIHAYLIRSTVDMNHTMYNALMDMYAKSGFIESASKIFSQLAYKDAISWTIMIHGYSLHGQGAKGVELFREMQKCSGVNMDQITYTSVLHAYKSANMLEEGRLFFNSIKKPDVGHYALMVSLLACAGLFDEAKAFIEEKNIARFHEVLKALFNGCRIYRGTETEPLYDLDSSYRGIYTLLSNWFDQAEWDKIDEWEQRVMEVSLGKKAYSWLEFRNKVHVFGVGDSSHPRSLIIYQELKHLTKKLEEQGYFSQKVVHAHDCIEMGHCELLAISFGLISSQRSTIRITKNLEICRNCHGITKAVSKIVGREIILKDPNCFHHFKDGHCSCENAE